MSRTESFLEYYVHVDKILGEYMQDKNFVDVEEYFAACPWMNDFYG